MARLTRTYLDDLRLRLLPRTLFGRSLMIIVLPLLLLQMSVAFMFFDRHWDTISQKLVFALAGEVRLLSDQIAHAKTQEEINGIIALAAKSMDIVITIDNAPKDGLRPGDSSFQKFYWFSLGTRLKEELGKKLSTPFAIRPDDRKKWFEIAVDLGNGKVARFSCPERRLASSATYVFLLWFVGSAIILFSIAVIFMRNQIRPIMRLAVAAEKFGKGQDVPDFKPVGASEVRRASQAFLQMKERLKRQMEQRTAMLSGVSHDLRTPLTRMRLQLAISKNSDEIANLREDIDEMEKMVEGYLSFAKGEGDETPEMTDLSAIIARVAANARRQGYDVKENLGSNLTIRVRPLAVERAIGNILSNACKYAPHAWIEAIAAADGGVTVAIDDDGPGIAKNLREEVFRPFYRIEKSRNKKTGGVGLGLSIAQDIVTAHGGEIELKDSTHGGLRVEMRLPA